MFLVRAYADPHQRSHERGRQHPACGGSATTRKGFISVSVAVILAVQSSTAK